MALHVHSTSVWDYTMSDVSVPYTIEFIKKEIKVTRLNCTESCCSKLHRNFLHKPIVYGTELYGTWHRIRWIMEHGLKDCVFLELGFLYRTFFIELIVLVTDPNSYCSCRRLVTWHSDILTHCLLEIFRPIIFYPTFNSNVLIVVIITLTSCPWGPVAANGLDLLTKVYVIGATVLTLQTCTNERTNERTES